MFAETAFPIFGPASHEDTFTLVLQIAVLLFTARLLGDLAQRFRQPAVIGEIFAGILLGPSILGNLFPGVLSHVIPTSQTQSFLLDAVSLIGAIFLLLITGLETDLKLIKHHAKTALGVSFGGIFVTFTSGFFLGQFLPDYLLADPDGRLVFSLFIATAMSISAIPVIAKVLIDLKLTRRDVGQTIIAAGMSDDTIGWVLLSVVAGLAAGQTISAGSIALSFGKVFLFLVFSFTAGRWLVNQLFTFVRNNASGQHTLLTLIVVMTFFWGSLTHMLHLEAVLGAFIMGILFGQLPRLPQATHEKLEGAALGIFAPIFFAVAGLKVDIQHLLRPDLVTITLLVILIASLGKVVGTYIGARLIGGKGHWYSLSFGAALNARGAMEIIVATIGLSLGILTQEMFSIIVVMAISTSLMAPFALRWVLRRVHPTVEELLRLRHEKIAEQSEVLNIYRILMPVRHRKEDWHLRAIQLIKAKILRNIASHNKLSVTLLSVDPKIDREQQQKFLETLGQGLDVAEVKTRAIKSRHTVEEVLKESHKDYELLILGSPKHTPPEDRESSAPRKPDFLFSRVTDNLIRMAPCPTLIVHTNQMPENWEPRNILVPTKRTQTARSAVEFAFMLASAGTGRVKILHVIEQTKNIRLKEYFGSEQESQRRLQMAVEMLKPLEQLGELRSIPTEIAVEAGFDAAQTILEVAAAEKSDLIILGTGVRPLSQHLFLGPRVEYLLKNSSCPVLILNAG